MLVLSRKAEEAIIIEHPAGLITVKLVEIRGDKARIGVIAPRAVSVHREGVYVAIHGHKTPNASKAKP